jgi:hypothetical protein
MEWDTMGVATLVLLSGDRAAVELESARAMYVITELPFGTFLLVFSVRRNSTSGTIDHISV